MKTTLLLSVIFFIAFIFSGCEKSDNVFQEDYNSTLKKKPVEKHERPFKITGVNTGFLVFPPSEEAICDAGPTLYLEGEGNATHMGRISISGHHCFNSSGCVWGPLNFTAANGDILYTFCGEDEDGNIVWACPNPDGEGIIGPGRIDGGTGRFENATGMINWIVIQKPDHTEIEAVGYIIY